MSQSHPPPKPPISWGDLVGALSALALTFIGSGVAAFLGLFLMAFTDNCPPSTCNIDAGVTAITAGFAAAAVVVVGGTVVTIVRLVRRNPAWPFALATLVLTAAACTAGIGGYITAVGG
ncbi:hypothetical protein [Mycolicibacter hiberniae]|uniref:hypothetical protein n=1 Tax=Mycolicibacter hiberniae TaxID=29314 RepID=UPI000A15244B|nr:hypothetical protein [Mycolicibacter hiberniae]MCV7086129.1 hypothetical protein [Mycolicibacter hiberniae]ORV70682.1 hypothetical protein AWC09_09600 [Mycolicibacter hiberniae]